MAAIIPRSRHQPNCGGGTLNMFLRRAMNTFFVLCVFFSFVRPAPAQEPILGFAPANAAREFKIETSFKSLPSPDEERRQHRIFTAHPHVAGSKRNNELARYVAEQWRKQGLEDVVIHRYD